MRTGMDDTAKDFAEVVDIRNVGVMGSNEVGSFREMLWW